MTYSAIASANPIYALSPVPTAVPPWANSDISGNFPSIRWIAFLIWWAYPENSWPKVNGVASWVWVLPILIILSNYLTFFSSSSCKSFNPGRRTLWVYKTAAICITVGKLSLLDWLRFTSSFGWTDLSPSLPPNIWMALFAITSLEFIFDWVPEPVCQMTNGKWSSSLPWIT